MYPFIVFASAAILSATLLLLLRKQKQSLSILLKIFTVLFCAVGFVRFFLSDSIVYLINGGWFENVFYDRSDPLHIILRWGYYINYAVLPIAVFRKSRFFKNLACYVALPFSILSTAFFYNYMEYFLSEEGRGFHGDPLFRHVYFAVELTLAIMIPLMLMISEKHVFKVKSLTEWRNFILGLPAVIFLMTPAYAINSFIPQDNFVPQMYSTYHWVWLAVTFVVAIAIIYIFRFRSYEERYTVCLFLTLVLFFHYNSLYLMGVTIKRLPFQLCNIAAYFYLLGVIFKWKKFLQFCAIANLLGTLFAMLAPDFSIGKTSFWNMHFLFEHSLVLIIPLAYIGLRIVPRLTWKSWKYYFIGFSAYIAFAYIAGTILNGYSDVTGETVNYFYMFDFKIAFSYFPFLRFIEDYCITIGIFTLYPLVPLVVYIGFTALCFIMFLALRLLYKFEDDHLELRRSSIDFWEKVTKRPSKRPREFIE
jgi:hypothetical protein